MSADPDAIEVRGPATPEEVAAVLAALRGRGGRAAPTPYEHWRAVRLAALARSTDRQLFRN